MKFLVTWSIDQDMFLPVLKKWAAMTPAERADAGAGVKIVGRWHAMGARTGAAVLETNDVAAMYRYLGQWNPVMDLDVVPVVDDDESGELAKSTVAMHEG